MGTLHISVWSAVFVMILGVPCAHAQQDSDDQETHAAPALRSPFARATQKGTAQAANAYLETVAPDTRSLAGAQDLSLGAPAVSHSFWQPLLSLTSTLDTDALTMGPSNSLTTWTAVYGGIDLRWVSHRSDLALNYLGGLIFNQGNTSNSAQQLELAEKLGWRRYNIVVINQFSYMPEAAFGFSFPSGLSPSGDQGLSLQQFLIPNQSILTTRGPRISNSFLTEVDTFLTPRSSVTVVGSYSLLRFLDNGFLNFGDAVFQTGYNHQFRPKDTIAVLYRFAAFRYHNFDQAIDGHVVQVLYGRRVTGRLAFQVAAGPEVSFFRTPISTISGYSGGATTTTGSSKQVYWTLDTSMTYRIQRTQLGFTYDHFLSGGAGVLAGAVNDQVGGSANRQLSHTLTGGFVMGYARNHGLSVAASTASSQSYNSWFSGADLRRRWGRATNLALTYRVQFQDGNGGFCVGATCGHSLVRHTLSIGIDWSCRPMLIEQRF